MRVFSLERLDRRILLAAAAVSYQPYQLLPTGSQPAGVAVGDLTGNGVEDIVTADQNDTTVGILLGNGNGVFTGPLFDVAGDLPEGVALGDLNGDGHLDVVTANLDDNDIGVLFGNGDGTFQPLQTIPTGDQPWQVAIADLTGNGIEDIITTDRGDNTVTVLMGNGDGTFQYPKLIGVGNYPQGLAVADLGNGHMDIITANFFSDTVSVLLGNGDGTFKPAVSYAVGSEPEGVAVGDFTNNGVEDIAVADEASNDVSILWGNGDGTFKRQALIPVGQYPFSITTADLNNDGYDDIAVGNLGNTQYGIISVLLSNGDGTFKYQAFLMGSRPWAITTADINGSGLPSIISADIADDSVSILEAGPAYSMPVTPTNVAATPGASGGIQVSWSAVSGATQYQVFRSTSDEVNMAVKVGQQIIGTDFVDNSAQSGQTYFYWVRARNPLYTGSLGGGVSSFSLGMPVVSAVNGLAPGQVDLSWNAISGAAGYQVFRNTVNDLSSATKIAFGLTATSYQDNSGTPGVGYYYWVRARNPQLIGPYSAVTPASAPLAYPANFAAISVAGQVGLTWDLVTGALQYQIFRSTDPNFFDATKIAWGITGDSYVDLNVQSGQTYYYWIRARNAAGIGLVSGAVVGTP